MLNRVTWKEAFIAAHHGRYFDDETVREYLEQNQNNPEAINKANEDGWTILMIAIWNSHLNIVRQFLYVGADLEATDKDGDNALTLAACQGNIEILRLILDQCPKINHQNNAGETALHKAVNAYPNSKQLYVAAMLLEAGIDASLKNKRGWSVEMTDDPMLGYLIQNNDLEVKLYAFLTKRRKTLKLGQAAEIEQLRSLTMLSAKRDIDYLSQGNLDDLYRLREHIDLALKENDEVNKKAEEAKREQEIKLKAEHKLEKKWMKLFGPTEAPWMQQRHQRRKDTHETQRRSSPSGRV